jgi:putative inorganic carbon (hco3(-)) transporter
MWSSFANLLKSASVPVWILSFYTCIWFLQIGDRITILGSVRFEFIIGSILVMLSFREWSNRKKMQLEFHHGFINAIFFLYFIFTIYSFASFDREHSLDIFIDRIVKFSMFTFFIGTLVRNKSEMILVIMGFLLAMAKIIEEGVVGVVGGGMVWQNQDILRLHGVTLLYRHPNSLSGLAVSALPFFLFLFQFQSKALKLFFAGCIVGLLVIVLYTGSRTGYVAVFILGVTILLRMGLFKAKTIAMLLAIIMIGSFVIPQDYRDRFGTMFKSKDELDGSANKRIEILEDAWSMLKTHPFGVGVQAFPHVRDLEFGRQQDTHNLYLEILTNLGFCGFAAFIVFVSTLFKVNIKSRKIFELSGEKFLAELCYIINLYIVCRLALGLFGMDLYEVYWWFAAGCTLALAKMAAREKTKKTVSQG